VGVFRPRGEVEYDVTGYTTPDAVLLARTLADLREQGAASLAIEASSIGLEQGRLSGMHFDVALFTNRPATTSITTAPWKPTRRPSASCSTGPA
jgi:UDP-N-acetylmuramoyl-L-alanyl-D-glutamate--2,6-diaminopimelate ligase